MRFNRKVICVFIAIAMAATMTLAGAILPANVEAQAYTPNQWNVTSIPSAVGEVLRAADVTDFAVASDGTTIYAVDAQTAAPGAILKSTNGGNTWVVLANPITAPATVAFVAVAPDDPDVVVVVDTTAAGNIVWLSTNGGAVWSNLGAPAAAPEVIYDVDVSPSRTGTVLGRDIVVATANPAAGAFGNLYLIGQTTAWTAVGIAATYDYTSVVFEPNWVGGRCVVAVASDGTWTYLQVRRATTPPVTVTHTLIVVMGVISPTEVGAPANAITSSSLALPSDFDSTTGPARQAYVGWTSSAGSDDVYRIDWTFARKLGIAANVGIQSISYSGTRAGGTLFAGQSASTWVWYSTNPQTALPTWSFSYKPPTGANRTIVAVAPDFDTSNTVYAGTTGAESGFSRSTNGGLSFNQLSLIDTAIAALDDVMPSPGASTLFLATNDGVDASLWRSPAPPSIGSWERVRLRAARVPITYIIRLSPEYNDDNALYYCQRGGWDIQRSTTGGDIFATRTASAAITDIVVESQNILYMASGINVYKSTDGASFFGLGIDAKIGPVYSLAMAPTYPDKPVAGNLLVGGTIGFVSVSTNAGDSFVPLLAAVLGATNMQVVADKSYADNNLVYVGSATPGQGIYRYEVGVSTAWENIRVPQGSATTGFEQMTGLAMHCGTLYGAWYDAVTPGSGCERCYYPSLPDIAELVFDIMNTPEALMGAASFNSVPSTLRVSGGDIEVWLWAIDTVAPALLAYPTEKFWPPLDAEFSAEPTEVMVCQDVNFTDLTTGGFPPYSYEWDFDRDWLVDSTERNPIYHYANPGTYSVSLRVTDSHGNTNTETKFHLITVKPPLDADFSAEPTEVKAYEWVNFTDLTTGGFPPYSYEWDFNNDGVIDSMERNPFYCYPDPGTYTVSLKVTDSHGNTNTETKENCITVYLYPMAVIDSIRPSPAIEGELVTFEGHGIDPDGCVVGYNWRSSIDGQLSPLKTFATRDLSVGTHIIYFKVKQYTGAWSREVSQTLEILGNQAPAAYIDGVWPSPAAAAQRVIFRGHGTDPDGYVVGYNWRSSIDGRLSTRRMFSTRDLSFGTHVIYFRVKDNKGAWSDEVSCILKVESRQSPWWWR